MIKLEPDMISLFCREDSIMEGPLFWSNDRGRYAPDQAN